MPFPDVQRVIYKRNPLEQVICQLRFPPILKIDAEIPAEFQDKVRKDYPNFSEISEWKKVGIPRAVKGQIPPEALRQVLQPPGNKNYEFSSENGQWQVNLTRTFIALTADNYERWEEFKDKLVDPLDALIAVYSPAHFSRIGLRYINVIRRSVLDLGDVSWSDLLQPYVLGILSSPGVGEHVQNFENRYEIRLSDGESVARVTTGFVQHVDDGEIGYMIDNDFYNTDKTSLDAAIEKLDYFNKRASRLIQWCITDRLHQAMEPQIL